MPSPEEILVKYWNYTSFRGLQKEIVQSVLDGKDTLALLPTGGGKSICYQVPALIMDGLCLVISPLIALMKDQVANLEKRGIPALALHSGLTFYETRKALLEASSGSYKFLYLSPERLETKLFKEHLPILDINLIAVDEAHCISQWGYDFRPPYLRIAALRNELADVPVLAVTASATSLVEKDITDKLSFKTYSTFRQSFERPNISFSVFKEDSKINKVIDILNKVKGSSIVYCKSRRLVKETAQLIAIQGIAADFYHAGLTQEERNRKQEAWLQNKTRVMVCTNAFGMGIDKPDVRTVVHYDTPDCLENYYQEAGRAGRDQKKAYTVLLYNTEDVIALKSLPDMRFPAMQGIRKVYQALADYLQIPVGIGEGNFYDFDLNEFIKLFKLDAHLVISVLKALEQEGLLTFSENIFLPAQVNFTAPKELLEDFENSHPELEPIIKCLLRTYEGIYDNRVSVHERQLAKLTQTNIDKIKQDLLRLKAFGIIEYLPQKETPQINFLTNRAPAEFLHINHEQYLERKQQYKLRVEVMLKYLQLKRDCRSKYIAQYFGDAEAEDCGVCDNCLNKKDAKLSSTEFKRIHDKIMRSIPVSGIALSELIHHLNGIRKNKAWQVLEYLQSEKKIQIDDVGKVFLVN